MKLSLDLVSDLDGTWLPARGGVKELRTLEAFLATQPEVELTFATGRGFESALSALGAVAELLPQHLVTDVGAAIHHRRDSGEWVEDAEYARWVDARWDREAAARVAQRPFPEGVRLQPNVLARRRLALEVAGGTDLLGAAEELAQNLGMAGLAVDVLPSNARCLDVLPRGVHKGTAVEHLRKDSSAGRPLVVCGDSENDLGMLGVADVAVIMADSQLRGLPAGSSARVVRPRSPGPAGILEVLLALAQPEPAVSARQSR